MARKPDDFTLDDTSGIGVNETGTGDVSGGNKDSILGTVDGDKGAIDPATIPINIANGDGTGENGKRRRGRPAGSKNSTTKANSSADIGAIQSALISIHTMLAIRIPEMAIEQAEAKMLAENIAAVEKYYPAVSSVITGKIAAHGALLLAIGQVYGTRIVAIQARVRKEKEEPRGGTVIYPPFKAQ